MDITDPRIQKYLTPYRYGRPVLTGSGTPGAYDEQAVDIPFVFAHGGQYHMLHAGFDGHGYQTALAVSDDLLHWRHKAIVLPRLAGSGRWDAVGAAGTWILKESDSLWDVPRLKKVDGKYWMVYHAYPMTGYEAGPAEIGLAWCADEDLLTWHRLDEPVYSWRDGGDWECGGLYKACLLHHDGQFRLFYNAKNRPAEGPWTEQTGCATSPDMRTWTRCAQNPLLRVGPQGAWDSRFVSDPYIVHDGARWVNFFFGYGQRHAMEGLALSDDLLRWEKVDQPILASGPDGALDSGHAHKASIFYENGRLWHFYCATRPWREGDPTRIYDELRTITVASDRPFAED